MSTAAGKLDPSRTFIEYFLDASAGAQFAALPPEDPRRNTLLASAAKVWLNREVDSAAVRAKAAGRTNVGRAELVREVAEKFGTPADLANFDAADENLKENYALAIGVWKFIPGTRPSGM